MRKPHAQRFLGASVAATLIACAGPGGHSGVSVSTSVGSAYVPPNVSSGTTTVVSYREVGGAVTRSVLKVMAAGTAAPRTRTTVTFSDGGTRCYGRSCYSLTHVTRTTTVLDSPGEAAAKVKRAAKMIKALDTATIPIEFRLDIAMRSLGGDTSGWMSSFMYQGRPRVLGSSALLQFSGGLGFGKYTFYDRTRTSLTTGLVDVGMPVESIGYGYIGVPLRATVAVGPAGVFSYLQADLNLLTFVESLNLDEGETAPPSPLHWAVGFRRGPLRITGDLALGRFRTSGMTASLELALVL